MRSPRPAAPWRCSRCAGPAKWTVIAGQMYEWCVLCSQQVEMFEEHLEEDGDNPVRGVRPESFHDGEDIHRQGELLEEELPF